MEFSTSFELEDEEEEEEQQQQQQPFNAQSSTNNNGEGTNSNEMVKSPPSLLTPRTAPERKQGSYYVAPSATDFSIGAAPRESTVTGEQQTTAADGSTGNKHFNFRVSVRGKNSGAFHEAPVHSGGPPSRQGSNLNGSMNAGGGAVNQIALSYVQAAAFDENGDPMPDGFDDWVKEIMSFGTVSLADILDRVMAKLDLIPRHQLSSSSNIGTSGDESLVKQVDAIVDNSPAGIKIRTQSAVIGELGRRLLQAQNALKEVNERWSITKQEMEELKRSRNEFLMRGDDSTSAATAHSTLASTLAGMSYERQVEHLIGSLKMNTNTGEYANQRSKTNLKDENNDIEAAINDEIEVQTETKLSQRKVVTIAQPESMFDFFLLKRRSGRKRTICFNFCFLSR